MKPELIVFDLDGTLVHFPFDHLFATAERVLRDEGLPPVERRELESAFADFEFFRVVEECARLKFAADLAAALTWQTYPAVRIFDHTLNCLDRLSAAGYRLALATSRDTPDVHLRQELDQAGLSAYFEAVAVRRDSSLDWSDKGPQLRELVQSLGIPAERVLMVGDNPRDISSAKQAGIGFTAALESGGIKPQVLAKEEPHWLAAALPT